MAYEENSSLETSVLVVEDFNETRLMLKMSLELRGYRVVEAVDGLEAVEVARRERPDLILMDIGLPVMDGFAAARAIREEPLLSHVPIVVVSAHGTPEYRIKAAAAGCNGYITKPLNFDRLANLLDSLLLGENQEAESLQEEGVSV
jgi:CheY-like chemotaxis protein